MYHRLLLRFTQKITSIHAIINTNLYRITEKDFSFTDIDELTEMRNELQRQITQTSGRLIRQLKSKDRRIAKVQKHCDIITAVLQASSLKRRKFLLTYLYIYSGHRDK